MIICGINAIVGECVVCEKFFIIFLPSRLNLESRFKIRLNLISVFSQMKENTIMPNSPKINEDKMMQVLMAWKTLAPAKSFGGMTLAQFTAQVDKSLAPRKTLEELDDQVKQQQALRDAEDATTMGEISLIVAGVVADPTEGGDSALYESMGYVRKSDKKSGLTRKKKTPENK